MACRSGNGCTSGHGIVGFVFFPKRSLVALPAFVTTTILTVYIKRHP